MDTIQIFSAMSGLSISPPKSSLFVAGNIQPSLIHNATSIGMAIGHLPIRYLGLPLTTKTMRRREYEPLVDRIRTKFLSWTHRFLSYAGRLQLIKAVIASITNFWQAVFRLPQGCLDTLESMCSNFLWNGSILKSTGIRVCWENLCLPYSEGGLGIRSFRETNTVFSLHLIWRLFKHPSSLWVSWIQVFLLRQSSFCDMNDNTTKGSWIWRKLLQLRPLAATLFRVEVKNGVQTHFWHDNWIGESKLWRSGFQNLTRELGISRHSKVVEAYTADGWALRRPRNRNLRETYDKVMNSSLPSLDFGCDVFLWKYEDTKYKRTFVSSNTWNLIRSSSNVVSWAHLIWFPLRIQHHAFVQWMVFKKCLPTGDKMHHWGVHQYCVLCGEMNETIEHLFFACPFSFQAWILLARNLLQNNISPDWASTLETVSSTSFSKIDSTLLRLVLQSSIYAIWRERNNRIHRGKSLSFRQLAADVYKIINLNSLTMVVTSMKLYLIDGPHRGIMVAHH